MATNRLSLAVSVEDLVVGICGGSHLVSNPSAPLNHFRYSILIQASARLPDGIHDRKITLQCIEGSNGVL